MLSWSGLHYRWPRAQAVLHWPDFEAPAGARVLLRGPSGSGKSTLLALLAGLLTPSGGRLQVAQTELSALPVSARDAWRGRSLGLVPQRLHLSDSLSVADNLRLPWRAAGLPPDEAHLARTLDALGLTGLVHRRPATLSLGQAQRVAIARALMRVPRVLLADEPTAHLDDAQALDALDLLDRSAAGQGATLVVATHDPRVSQAWPHALDLRLNSPGSRP